MENKSFKNNGVHLQEHEFKTVKILLSQGHNIELIPPSRIKGMRTPDMVMDGKMWEMKSPEGNSKRTIMNTIQNASHQAVNIIIDLQRCKLEESKALEEIKHHFSLSKRIRKIKIITKNQEIIDLNK